MLRASLSETSGSNFKLVSIHSNLIVFVKYSFESQVCVPYNKFHVFFVNVVYKYSSQNKYFYEWLKLSCGQFHINCSPEVVSSLFQAKIPVYSEKL